MEYKFGIEVPRIENEGVFENICLDMVKVDDKFEQAQLNGRRGQRQNGVDIFYRKKDKPNEWIGIQCKVKSSGKITESEIKSEIEKAKTFNPLLTTYIIFTTANRDAKIQEFIRLYQKNTDFSVEINFWEDIASMLCEERFEEVHYKYYSQFYLRLADYEKQIQDGYCYGKIISIDIAPSCYKLMIGRIIGNDNLRTDNTKKHSLSYWANSKFVVNLFDRTFETFPDFCFPSDLELAIKNKRDCWFICKWLNSIDMDEILRSDEVIYCLKITKELEDKWRATLANDKVDDEYE